MLTIDFETKSEADLTKVGAWNYSLDPTTEVICLAYFIDRDDEERKGVWTPGKPCPADIVQALNEGMCVEAHNVAFEEAIWQNVMVPRYGWPYVIPHKWRDSMATACYLALPAALDKLSLALGGSGKDPEGARLISKYSKLHLKTAKREIPPDDLMAFIRYCEDDVAQEAGISEFLGDLPSAELESFIIDREMNRRGLYLDVEGIEHAITVVEQRAAELSEEFEGLTGLRPTQRDRFLVWLHDRNAILPNLQAETIKAVLGEEGYAEEYEIIPGFWGIRTLVIEDEDARRALEIRNLINKASTKKLITMLRNVSPDGRARNQSRYHGAATGRNTGAGIQPLNLVRSWEDVDPDNLVADITLAAQHKEPNWLDFKYGDAMEAVSRASRHWIRAEPGNELVATDYVSIEAVVLACLAGEEWKIEAFRNKELIYERMAEKIHGLSPGTVTKKTHPLERQDGKVGELAFGYQGALGAWRQFDKTDRHTDERVIQICKSWREEHPAIDSYWHEMEQAMHDALAWPGSIQDCRGIEFRKEDHWLSMRLLNGKKIWYFQPEFRSQMPSWHKPDEFEECANGTCSHKPRPVVTYMAQKAGKFQRVSTYGGKIVENATQAMAREILEVGKRRVRKELGFNPFILSVYDEAVAEVPRGSLEVASYEKWLLEPEDWYADWPISCDTWVGERYRK